MRYWYLCSVHLLRDCLALLIKDQLGFVLLRDAQELCSHPCAQDKERPALPHYPSLSLFAGFRARLGVATAAKFQVVPEIAQNRPFWEADAAVKVEKARPGSGPCFVPDAVPTLDFRRICNHSWWMKSFYRLWIFSRLSPSQREEERTKKKVKL